MHPKLARLAPLALLAGLATPAAAQAFESQPTPIALGTYYGVPATFDLENDGDLDLVVRAATGVSILVNDGTGTFTPWSQGPQVQAFVSEVCTADFDGDGWTDVAIGEGSTIAWYRNLNGTGFGAAKTVTQWANQTYRLFPSDINNDGFVDLVAHLGSPERVVWFAHNQTFGPVGPILTVKSTVGVFNGFEDVEVADVNQDGFDDVVYSAHINSTSSNFIGMMFNQGGTSFVDAPGDFQGVNQDYNNSVGVLDLDRDGDLDVLSADNKLVSWENDGSEHFAPSTDPGYSGPFDQIGSATQFELVDLTGDGFEDVLSYNVYERSITWRSNRPAGAATELSIAHLVLSRAMAPDIGDFFDGWSYGAADLDGDGDCDVLLTSNSGSFVNSKSGIYMVKNRMTEDCNGNGQPDNVDVLLGTSADCNGNGVPDECDLLLEWHDVDGDGQLDDCVMPAFSSIARVEYAKTSTGSIVWAGGVVPGDHFVSADPGLQASQWYTLRSDFPDDAFWILGSLSGTSPGIPLGSDVLPLAYDPYFQFLLGTQTFALVNKLGSFQEHAFAPGVGFAAAVLELSKLPPTPSFAGLTAHHAFVGYDPATLQIHTVSNAVPTYLMP